MRPYDLAKSIFLQALDVPAAERPAFVAAECAGDDKLRADVESLLRFHDDTLDALVPDPEVVPESFAGYRIERELGRGGMGVVYLARGQDGVPVALKLLRQGLLSPTLLARFRREAEVLARLDHPGIARLLGTGIEEGPAGLRPWLAMEFMEGEDLRAWARRDPPAAARLDVMAQVCDAAEHAHRRGIVHRDLKPENVLVRPDGRATVLDFGVARLADTDVRATTVMTHLGVLVGTIRYMSPEQAEGRADTIGPRSDVHALGVVAYELLTGRLPFEVPERSVHRALVAVMTAPPRAMSELPTPLRAPLERVLRAALAKDPAERTASAAALAEDLRRVIAGRRPLARPPQGARWAGVTPRAWLAFASGAALVGLALSAWRTPPTPMDWLQGVARPGRMFARVTALVDSASVRLHYTTRTLEREREAITWARRGRELARTVGWTPWGGRLERVARFREGEATYLVAERTNDVAMYIRAADLWRSSCDDHFPRMPVALPDSASTTAVELLLVPPQAPWNAASMAYADAARLARPDELFPRALQMARAAQHAVRAAKIAFTPWPPEGRPRVPNMTLAMARQLGSLEGSTEARLGVALAGCALATDDSTTLRAALPHLRRAVVLADSASSPAMTASHVHELGVAEAHAAAYTRDRALLDSALVHLERARSIRSTLEGYTSQYLSQLELAQALRLAARIEPENAAAALGRAAGLLALAPRERESLGELDRALFALARGGLIVDRCCVRRDTTGLATAVGELADAARAFGTGRTPQFLARANLERARVDALRWAVGGGAAAQGRAHQALDIATLPLKGERTRSRLALQIESAQARLRDGPRPYALEWPAFEPY